MRNLDFTTIYNLPEKISGLGYKSHLIGLCLFVALFVCAILCVLIDGSWIKDSIGLVAQSGILVILGVSFIFILCPLYFFIRFIMEIIRTIKSRHEFYSTPNIEYIKLNDTEILFKNTNNNEDFLVNKSDITKVCLDGKVNTTMGISIKANPQTYTYIENLTLTISTHNDNYIIYPKILDINTLKKQIEFYKNYFDNFYVLFDFDGTDTVGKLESFAIAHELETGKTEKTTNYFDILLKIIVIVAFIYFIIFELTF